MVSPVGSYHLLFERITNFSPKEAQTLFQQETKCSLEVEFEGAVCADIDTMAPCHFADYLEPNETKPLGLVPHLNQMEEGLVVSAGTERSFFAFLLSDPQKCTGLVVRDFNPRVKAYIDFVVMLLRISRSRAEFISLAQYLDISKQDQLVFRVQQIRSLLEPCDVSPRMKAYYLKHLEPFARVYFSCIKKWSSYKQILPDNNFSAVNYFENDAFFLRLQLAARSGQIIATLGDINELQFLDSRKISVVDISNINSYSVINLKVRGRPRVIWSYGRWQYRSYVQETISRKDQEEIIQALPRLIYLSGLSCMAQSAINPEKYLMQCLVSVNEDLCEAGNPDNPEHASETLDQITLNRVRLYLAQHPVFAEPGKK